MRRGARNFEPAFSADGRCVAFVHAGAGSHDPLVKPLAASFSRRVVTR